MQINDEQNYRCAGVILIHANNSFQDAYILLGQSSNQNNPCWGGFGGQLKPDELWEDAAAREFYEETLACIDPLDATETDKLSIAERICNLSTSLKNKTTLNVLLVKKTGMKQDIMWFLLKWTIFVQRHSTPGNVI